MLDVQAISTKDLKALSPAELAEVAARMLAHITEQSKHIDAQSKRIDSQAQAIKWRDAKIESITFQLARLKAWRFGAKSERMNAEQREIFEETLAADQADLEAQLAALQQSSTVSRGAPDKQQRRQPKREALPPHLPRVDQRIEPEDTRCPAPECRQPMVRVGEAASTRASSSRAGPARSSSMPMRVMFRLKICCGRSFADGQCTRTSGHAIRT